MGNFYPTMTTPTVNEPTGPITIVPDITLDSSVIDNKVDADVLPSTTVRTATINERADHAIRLLQDLLREENVVAPLLHAMTTPMGKSTNTLCQLVVHDVQTRKEVQRRYVAHLLRLAENLNKKSAAPQHLKVTIINHVTNILKALTWIETLATDLTADRSEWTPANQSQTILGVACHMQKFAVGNAGLVVALMEYISTQYLFLIREQHVRNTYINKLVQLCAKPNYWQWVRVFCSFGGQNTCVYTPTLLRLSSYYRRWFLFFLFKKK
jgi:hypothetical protein